jgi:fimbrial chaperone protein
MRTWLMALALAGSLMASQPALAGSLQVAPVIVEVPAPGAAATLKLTNQGGQDMAFQIRIYKWSQAGGKDELVETRDVVASPPIARIKANGTSVVRIVRTSKAPIAGEESYRLLVDEIPRTDRKIGSGVNFAMRYSIPVFFGVERAAAPTLSWVVESRKGKTTVIAHNPGTSRASIAGLTVQTPAGGKVAFSKGLVGYVLPGATMRWTVKGNLKGASDGGKAAISALTNHGKLQATATIRAAQ